jgi:hypothetical protein
LHPPPPSPHTSILWDFVGVDCESVPRQKYYTYISYISKRS